MELCNAVRRFHHPVGDFWCVTRSEVTLFRHGDSVDQRGEQRVPRLHPGDILRYSLTEEPGHRGETLEAVLRVRHLVEKADEHLWPDRVASSCVALFEV